MGTVQKLQIGLKSFLCAQELCYHLLSGKPNFKEKTSNDELGEIPKQ